MEDQAGCVCIPDEAAGKSVICVRVNEKHAFFHK